MADRFLDSLPTCSRIGWRVFHDIVRSEKSAASRPSTPAGLTKGGCGARVMNRVKQRKGMASPTGVVPEWTRQIPGEVPAVGTPTKAA
jgi:hypothetical protein